MPRLAALVLACATALGLVACGGGGGGGTPPVTIQAPSITAGPASATVSAGSTVTLAVTASGSGLAYQWRVNGADIAGATGASYTTPALAAGDSGASYTVVVSNGGGSVTSAAAVLTVNAAPTASIALTQASAEALVAQANAGVDFLLQADLLNDLPIGTRTVPFLPIGTTVSEVLSCADFTGSGSGSIGTTLTFDAVTGAPVSGVYSFDDCRFDYEGYSYSIDGGGIFTVLAFVSESNFRFSVTYDVNYSFTSEGVTESDQVVGTATCTVSGTLDDCAIEIDGVALSDVELSSVGGVTTIGAGRIESAGLVSVYEGWVFDGNTGRATAGRVTVTAANGDRAVLTVGSGGYVVVITVSGTSSTFTVPFGG
jgi:hypothetical protein